MRLTLNAFSAGALGTYLALLIALSTSPVVAATVATLLAAAMLFLTLSDKVRAGTSETLSDDVLVRILAFSLCGAIALWSGLQLRVSSVDADQSLLNIYNEVKSIGIADREAQETALQIYKARQEKLTERERQAGTALLFANQGSANPCGELLPEKFSDGMALKAKFEFFGGTWSFVAANAERLGYSKQPNELKAFLAGAYILACQPTQ